MKKAFTLENPQVQATLYTPESDCLVGMILLVHDVNEHRFRYEPLIDFLNQHHLGVISYDLIGHHQSNDLNIRKNQSFLSHINQITLKIHLEYPSLPLSLMGVGVGALLAQCAMCLNYDHYHQLIMVSPHQLPQHFQFKKTIIRAMARLQPDRIQLQWWRWLYPVLKQKQPIVSLNPQLQQDYQEDAFCGYRLTNKLLLEVLTVIEDAYHVMASPLFIDKKIILIGGKQDPLTHYGASLHTLQALLQAAGFASVAVYLFDEVAHDCLLEARSNFALVSLLEKIIQQLS